MMSENFQPTAASGAGANNGDGQPGVAHYEKQRQILKELIQNRKLLERQLIAQDQAILLKETEYLENTPYGNIIAGFDGYIKGSTSNATAQRKRSGLIDQNRIFSRSSISHNPSHPDHADPLSATSTSAAPTPISTTFVKEKDNGSSSHPTPTSAAASASATATADGNNNSNNNKKGASKKKKMKKEVDDDSEMDTRDVKKVRTHFGSRK
ncbi:histone acetyltransferase subunit NuA4-domain-containing protein [Xylaria sp. CBS 124048]|nr:histone acetyltransferase subunit NuA4-domain-containing protein [Xylaria sp. CBS 124048]